MVENFLCTLFYELKIFILSYSEFNSAYGDTNILNSQKMHIGGFYTVATICLLSILNLLLCDKIATFDIEFRDILYTHTYIYK